MKTAKTPWYDQAKSAGSGLHLDENTSGESSQRTGAEPPCRAASQSDTHVTNSVTERHRAKVPQDGGEVQW